MRTAAACERPIGGRASFRLLVAVIVATGLFGLAMVLLPGLTLRGFGLLVYGTPEALLRLDAVARHYVELTHAVLGATIFGWSVALLAVALGPLRRRSDAAAWRLIALSLLAWFLPDTTFSLLAGSWPNAVLNLVFALAFAAPLAALRPHLAHHDTGVLP